MKKIRCLIVDDEPLLREGIRLLLQKQSDIVIVGECGDGATAVEMIESERPDIVFLDVQMPQMSGFEALGLLDRESMPLIIFVTAYDEYAVDAFEVRALDYLLKPFTDRRFFDSLDRARERIRQADTSRVSEQIADLLDRLPHDKESGPRSGDSAYPHRLAVRDLKRVRFVDVDDIYWFESAGNYVHLHTKDKKHLIRQTLKNLESRLDPHRFVRVHRGAIVNLSQVKEILEKEYGDAIIALKNGARIPASRTHRQDIKRLLDEL